MGLATQEGLLSQFSTVELNELPPTISKPIAEKSAPSPRGPDGHRRKYFDSANMQIVIVGDRAQIESQAALFGDLTVFDSQGNQL